MRRLLRRSRGCEGWTCLRQRRPRRRRPVLWVMQEAPANIGESHDLTQADISGQDEEWRAQQELNLPKSAQFPNKSGSTVAPGVTKSNSPDDLGEILDAWPELGDDVRNALLTIVRSVNNRPQKAHTDVGDSYSQPKETRQ